MADDTTQNGTDKLATDELATYNGVDVSAASPRIKAARTKLGFGTDGVYDDITAAKPLPVTGDVDIAVLAAAAPTRVASSATVVTLKAANASRRSLSIYNESTAVLYVKFGSTATATDYTVQIAAGGYYEMPTPAYTGIVTGIWASANGAAQVTEGT